MMKDMVLSAEDKRDMDQRSVVLDTPKYPYGLKIHFDAETYARLELPEAPDIGQKVMILAVGEVCDLHQEKYEGDVPKMCMGVQLMEVDVKFKEEKEKEDRDVAKELYGDGE